MGRFTFALFDVIEAEERRVFEGGGLLPPRQGRQWYQRCGVKELALLDGAAQRSYRQTVMGLNRWRRQLAGGTPLYRRPAYDVCPIFLEIMPTKWIFYDLESTLILKLAPTVT